MKTKILLITILFFSFKGYNQTWQWMKAEPNGKAASDSKCNAENDNVYKVVNDSAGNIYEIGSNEDTLYLNGTYQTNVSGSFIAKFDSSGNLIWKHFIQQIGATACGANTIAATDICVNGKGVFITGNYERSTYSKTCYPQGETNSYKIGSYQFTSGTLEGGMFFTSFDFNGNVLWNKLLASSYTTGNEPPCNIITAGDLTNSSLLTTDNNNNVYLSFSWRAFNNQNFSMGSDNFSVGFSKGDIFNMVVIKYASTGNLQWYNFATGLGDPNAFYNASILNCKGLIADNSNNIFLYCNVIDSTQFNNIIFRTGNGQGSYSTGVLAKLSSTGVWQFAKQIANGTTASNNENGAEDGLNNYNVQNFAVDNANNLYALVNVDHGGEIFDDTINGSNTQMFLCKFNNNGVPLWYKQFGPTLNGTDAPGAEGITYANNQLYISGSIATYPSYPYIFSKLFLPTYNYVGGYGIFSAKADTSGNFKWVQILNNTPDVIYETSSCAYGSNIYVAGYYYHHLNGLGNLNGRFTGGYFNNIFFGKLKDQYIAVGTIKPTTLTSGCTITIPFSAHSLKFSSKNKFTAELSDVNGDFTNPTVIGSTTSTGTGSITATIPTTVDYGSGYRVRIRSSDTLATGYNYYAYADTEYALTLTCPAPSAGFSSTNITGTSATLNWSVVACGKGYIIQYKPSTSNTWKNAYVSTNTGTVNLTGLSANTTYQWQVKTKCQPGSTAYYSAYTSSKKFTTTASAFAVADVEASSSTNEIKVYPNPANKNADVVFNTTQPGKYAVELTDVSGKQLQLIHGASIKGINKVSLDVSKYAQGIYLIKVTNDEIGTRTLKLNKQ